ncbi:MAG: hypothetical protein V4596_00880 [Bdellovibrionota bacterium]
MKKIIPHLTVEQKVWALVEEVNGLNLIVSFQGDLIRVGNQSGRRFRPGQRIQLKVVTVEPLSFKLLELRSEHPIISKLDISI